MLIYIYFVFKTAKMQARTGRDYSYKKKINGRQKRRAAIRISLALLGYSAISCAFFQTFSQRKNRQFKGIASSFLLTLTAKG